MTDQTIWQTAPLNTTVDYVIQQFHETHRHQFETILPLAEKVSSVHKDSFNPEIFQVIQYIIEELSTHMMKEENVLFPMIKQGLGRRASMPIRMMLMEHNEHTDALNKLLQLTDNLVAPEYACGSWQRLYKELAQLVQDLRAHIDFENNVLFLRALNE